MRSRYWNGILTYENLTYMRTFLNINWRRAVRVLMQGRNPLVKPYRPEIAPPLKAGLRRIVRRPRKTKKVIGQ